MADVFFKLTSEEKDAVNALMKVIDAQKGVEGGYKKIREKSIEADKSASDMGKTFEKAGKTVVDGLIPGVLSLTTVAGAAAAAVATINDQLAKSEKRAAATSAEVLKLANSLAQAGKISMFPEIEKQVKSIAGESSSMTEAQVRGVATSLGSSARKLSPAELTQAMQYAVKSADAGLDPAVAGKMYAQVRGLNPGAKADVIERSAGQLLSLKSEPLDDDEMLHMKRGISGGQSFERMMALTMARRKSGESGKSIDKIMEQMGEEITPEMLKPHEELPQAAKERVEALKRQDDTLKLQEESTKSKSKKKKIQEQLAKNAHEMERLEHGKIESYTPEQERLKRLAAIPEDQRATAWLDDPTLVKSTLQAKATNLAAAVKSLQANPPADLLESTIKQTNALPGDAKERILASRAQAKATARAGEVDNGLDKNATNDELMFDAYIKRNYSARGGGVLAAGMAKFRRLNHAMGGADFGFDRYKEAEKFKADHPDWNKPAKVEITNPEDVGPQKPNRVTPARNGGD